MEVAGLVLSAAAFVDVAIKSQSALVKLAREYPEARAQISSAGIRLEAQRYTLELWHMSWIKKAESQKHGDSADKFRALWGDDGYDLILKCLAQLNARFGEALRTLRSISPEFSSEYTTTSNSLGVSLLGSTVNDKPDPSKTKIRYSFDSRKTDLKEQLLSISSRSLKFWKRPSIPPSPSVASASPASTSQDQDSLIKEQTLTPGTKFKWSLGLKDELRLLIDEIDDWLKQLDTLSLRCEAEQKSSRNIRAAGSLRGIRAAASALYSVVIKDIPQNELQFKLEQERADSGYFDQFLGPIEYLDRANSFKFPLLVTSERSVKNPFLLVAEVLDEGPATEMLKGKGKIKTMEEILAALKKANSEATTTANLISGAKSSEPILLQCSRTVIAIHAIPILSITNQTAPRCTYTELLEAESAIDPLIARWKRIQLACIIAVSVLHLYETGWLSENLEMADFLFFGTANSHYHLHSCMAPYISPKDPKPHMQTPFECLKGAGDPQTYLGARDQRLATLFHRLGIVLFELGRGMDYRTIAAMSNEEYAGLKPEDIEMLRKSKVIQEIEKIPFGRSYADLVKFCLTGRLYATSLIDFDRRFNEAVVEKLGRLEMHFSAILEDE